MAEDLAFIEAGCRVLGIPLDPAWLPAIAFNVGVIATQGQMVLSATVGDHDEPGPVFTA